jgi:hypothetical protein
VPVRTAGVLALALAAAVAPHPATAADGAPLLTRLRALVARVLAGDADESRCPLGEDVVGGIVEPGARAVVVAARKKAWEAALGGEEAARPHVRARLAGWPAPGVVDPATLPADDAAFVARVARDTWRGLTALTDREHALPVDHVRLGATDDPADARVGDYVNVSTVGLHLLAIVAAHDLRLVTAPEAAARLAAVLDTLDRLETHAGFFYNYYDTTSLERTSNLISFVDSAWLTAALMVVRTAFPALSARCARVIDAQDYRFFYDPAARLMTHGWYAHLGAASRYHYGLLNAESRLGSLLAVGKGDVPEAHWFAMARTLPAACGWQTQMPRGRRRKTVRGHALRGGWYEWGGVRYVPSWGGSMFEALMPTLVVDEAHWAPGSLGANGVAHVDVQRRFAAEALGYPVWGLSPSATPGPAGYGEYGVRPLGTIGYGAGVVTPHAAALALAVAPAEGVANLRALAGRYPVYGDFGFYDAVDPLSGAVARAWLALDQAMLFVAAANHLTGGAVQRRFEADPIAARALPVLADERFFD